MKAVIQGNNNKYVHGLMLFTMTLIAFSFPVGAAITHAMPPEVMMFIRFLMASILFAPYVFIKNGFQIPPFKSLLNYTLLSVPLVVFFWCMFESLRFTSAMNTGALYTTVPAMTAVFAFFINKARTGKLRSFGLLLGTVGALWIVFRGELSALLNIDVNSGDLIFLLGCFFMAAYGPLVKKLYAGEPMEVMTLWVIFIGTILLLLLSMNNLTQIQWLEVKPSVYLGLGYLAIFTTLLSFFVLQLATVKIGATKVAAYGYLTPILVIVLSVLLGEGSFDWKLVPGIFLVLLAMVVINCESRFQWSSKGSS